ncbi:MAG TPA: glycosyltransferase family 4 protein [Anaerolineales bacterium]|nr:glycosyltransferase family 4 protein [Anaerolineales bacterium]
MLSQFYPPLNGGIEQHVQSLSQTLVQRGHEVSVATLMHKNLPEFESVKGVKIYRIRGTMQRLSKLFTTDRQHAPPFPDFEVVVTLRKIIKQEQPEIIHAHDWMIRSFLPIKRWSKGKLVRTLHDCELACAQMRYMFKDTQLCEGPSGSRCAACVTHHYGRTKGLVTLGSNWGASQLEKGSVDAFIPVSHAIATANRLDSRRQVVHVLPNFVRDDITQEAESLDPDLQLPPPGFILQVGDLVPDKGINVLLQAYRQLQSPPPLVLIGRRLANSPQELPQGVILIENLPHALVMAAWKRCLFGIVASTCLDASPTVTLEAMASGRAVIGSRIGGIADQIVDQKTGLLVQPGNVEQLKDAMTQLILNTELRARFGSAAKERVKDFQACRVVNQIEDIYHELAHGKY